MHTCFLLILLTSFSRSVYGQLTTSTALTPQQLVNNVLIGTGVSVSNISYTGSSNAIGSFDGTNCNVGINAGVILTTGTVLNSNSSGTSEGPHGPNTQGGAGIDNSQPGDPLLAAAAGNPSFNAARLEFDFVPVSDSIKFNFVFASEEYLEFVNAGVNDAFGFFISGQNPTGGNYADRNIALIPGTSTPITIDNLNATSNPSYYIDNGDGMTAPYNASNSYIQYDGLTKVLTAKAHVVCGETYHIIIVISDIGDGVLDSGVFLEAGSFTSPGIDISANLSFQGNVANDSTLFEGCSDATMWFVRNDSIDFQQTLPLTLSGSAQNGVDYVGIPSQVVFPAGQDSVSVTFNALFDNIQEGLESIQINISVPSYCSSEPIEDSIIMYIQNVDQLAVNIDNDTITCPGDNATLTATTTGGTANYSYLWDTGGTTASIQVSPSASTNYTVTVTDTCGQTATTTATVHIPTYVPLILDIANDTTVHCTNLNIDLSATYQGGAAGYSILWNDGQTMDQITVQPTATTTYLATVTDQCGNTTTDSATVTIQEIPLTVNAGKDTTICKGGEARLVAVGSGGYGNTHSYLWSNGSTDSIAHVSPSATTNYIVALADGCGVYKAWDTVVVNVLNIEANFIASGIHEENLEIHFVNLSIGADSYQWNFDNGMQSTQTHPSMTYESDGFYNVMLIATNADNGCVDTTFKNIQINPEFYFYAPNAFTPDGDEYNDEFFGKGIGMASYSMEIYSRWGEQLFNTHEMLGSWDGTHKGILAPDGIYIYKFIIKNLRGEVKEFTGHVNLLR